MPSRLNKADTTPTGGAIEGKAASGGHKQVGRTELKQVSFATAPNETAVVNIFYDLQYLRLYYSIYLRLYH